MNVVHVKVYKNREVFWIALCRLRSNEEILEVSLLHESKKVYIATFCEVAGFSLT